MKKSKIKNLVMLALLIGLNIVFSRFISISTDIIKISFTFITLAVAGYMYGPIYGGLVGGIGDFIGALVFPKGVYNPYLTITALLSGVVFGLFLHNKLDTKRIVLAAVVSQIAISLFINSFIISKFYNMDYWATFSTRIVQCLIMIVVEIFVLRYLSSWLVKLKERYE